MVTTLALGCVILLLAAAGIFLWYMPALSGQRKAAVRHAEAMLLAKAPQSNDASQQRLSDINRIDHLLIRANLPPSRKTVVLLVLPTVVFGLAALIRSGSFLFALFAVLLVAAVTAAWLYRRIMVLQRAVISQLPDFLEHMVRIAAVGNSLPMAFQGAASHTKPPLLPIIEQAQRNTRAGMDIDRALHQAATTYRIQPLEMVALIMGTSMRIGGRSDQIIQRMADFMRDLEQAQREFSATTSETRMSAIVLGLLPLACGFLMALTNPDFFTPMFEEPLGRQIMIVAVLLEVVGVTLLWRLAKSV